MGPSGEILGEEGVFRGPARGGNGKRSLLCGCESPVRCAWPSPHTAPASPVVSAGGAPGRDRALGRRELPKPRTPGRKLPGLVLGTGCEAPLHRHPLPTHRGPWRQQGRALWSVCPTVCGLFLRLCLGGSSGGAGEGRAEDSFSLCSYLRFRAAPLAKQATSRVQHPVSPALRVRPGWHTSEPVGSDN